MLVNAKNVDNLLSVLKEIIIGKLLLVILLVQLLLPPPPLLKTQPYKYMYSTRTMQYYIDRSVNYIYKLFNQDNKEMKRVYNLLAITLRVATALIKYFEIK